MATYTADTTIEALTAEQLDLMARSQHDLLVGFLKQRSVFDAHRIRLLIELGVIEAGRRLQILQTTSPAPLTNEGDTAQGGGE